MEKNVIFLILMLSITITSLIYFLLNYYLDCKKVNNIQINYDKDVNIDNIESDSNVHLSDKVQKKKSKISPKSNTIKSQELDQSNVRKYNKEPYDLIFYWANWCGICQKVKPLWKQARNEIEKIYKNVTVKEVNCDTPSIDKCYIKTNNESKMLDGVPTILLRSKNGDIEYKRNDFLTGDRSKNDLMKFLEINLKK